MRLFQIGSLIGGAALVLLLLVLFLSRTRRSHRRLSMGALTMPPDFVRRCANPLFCGSDRQSRYDLARWYESIGRSVHYYKNTQTDEEETPQRWMMENFHLIDMIHTSLGAQLRRNAKGLPFIRSGGVCVPRIRYIAHDILDKQMCRVRQAAIVKYLEEFQSVTPLRMNEIWMLHDYLELEIIGRLERIGRRLTRQGAIFQRIDAANELLPGENGLREWRQIIEPLLMNGRGEIEAECVEYVNLCLLDMGGRAAEAMAWFDDMLARRGFVQDKIITAAHRQRAEELILTRNAFESLKLIKEIKWSDVFEQASLVERTLLRDPGGIYPRMDDMSRVRYRERIAELSVRFRKSELYLAQSCLAFAQKNGVCSDHVGFCLFDRETGGRWMRSMGARGRFPTGSHRRILYWAGLLLVTAAGVSIPFWIAGLPAAIRVLYAAGLFVPAYLTAGYLLCRLSAHFVRPERIVRLRIEGALPPEGKTLVVITALAAGRDSVDELAAGLETAMLRNRSAEACYALLLDLQPAPRSVSDEDEELIEYAGRRVEALNERYGKDLFYCFIRKRTEYDAAKGRYVGWERKRGALLALCELLEEGESRQFMDLYRCPGALRGVRYVITLDADTRVGWGSVRELVGAMLHPLNKPFVSGGRVVRGYGLMQPRVSPSIESLIRTPFASVYGGDGGIETYAFSISDPYQDLFGIGIYTGKAIFDLRVYHQVLRDRLPDRAILSHDLIEGGYLRAGSLNDHVFIDDFPLTAGEYFGRLHRWIRGDWQLLPWLMPRVRDRKGNKIRNALPLIVRWQIAENLIRSLYPAVAFPLLAAGFYTETLALALTAAVLPVALPQLFSTIRGMMTGNVVKIRGYYLAFGRKLLMDLAFMPQHAFVQMDAVARTLVRVCLTRRNMLEWTTARQARSRRQETLGQTAAGMAGGLALTLLTSAAYALSAYPMWGVAFSAAWLLSPALAYWAGRERGEDKRSEERLSPDEEFELRGILVRTWRYFRAFTRKGFNWLPPDNYQEHPANGLALRTSPTNIGLSVLAEAMAVTLGYQSVEDALFRLESMMNTLESLEKWEGHLLNWYDIRDGKPLHPYYVSSVDSGNLACYLSLSAQMLEELIDQRRISGETLSNWLDIAAVLGKKDRQWHRQALETLTGCLRENGRAVSFDAFLPEQPRDHDPMETALREAAGEWRDLYGLMRRLGLRPENFTIRRAAEGPDPDGQAAAGEEETIKTLRRCRDWRCRVAILSGRMRALCSAMNFTVLFHEGKKLFHIGYDIDRDQFSNSYYDLLASEARQTSLFAIATGQVPPRHWFRMGRPSVADRRGAALKSWGGTIFEYLMPELIFRHGRGTLLGESIRNIVRMQREYARKRGIPWGISESGCYELDQFMNYQYRSFGVPGIGMKNGLGRDLIVSPYSSVLALPVDPRAAWDNIRTLIGLGALSEYGLYEAIDYTSGTGREDRRGRVVRSHMVHHQGMSMMAMYNYLTENGLQRSMAAIPEMGALSILLSERMLRTGKPMDQDEPVGVYRNLSAACYREECSADWRQMERSINVLSNGNYHITIEADGTGQSRCAGTVVNRWRRDNEAEYGIFLFIRGDDHRPHSVTMRPYLREPDEYRVVHECGQSQFVRRDGEIETRMTVFVQGNRNVEVRRLQILNHADRDARLEVVAYTELALNCQSADIAHPAFQNLFIQTRWDEEKKALISCRRKRSELERRIFLAARFVRDSEPDAPVEIETMRDRALGRGNSLKTPDFLYRPWNDGGKEIPIDPVLCMKTPVTVCAGGSAELALLVSLGDEEAETLAAVMDMGGCDGIEEALELSCCQVRALIRYLGVSASQLRFFNRLLPVFVRDCPPDRERAACIARNRLGQSGLWGLGLSGDVPVVCVEIADSSYLKGVHHLVTAHAYWRRKDIPFDLVIINRDASDYRQALQEALVSMLMSGVERDTLGKRGGIFILKEEQMTPEQACLLRAVAVGWFDAEKPLTGQLPLPDQPGAPSVPIPLREPVWEISAWALRPIETAYDNGYGGFDVRNREYVLHCRKNTPMPWCNVLANREFGVILTGGGAGFAWMHNSRENKLTPWNSDPVTNPPGQDVLVRDEDTGAVWRAVEGDGLPGHRRTRFGMGYAVFESVNNGFFQQQRIIVPSDETVMIRLISLHNQTRVRRRISVTAWADFVLGEHRSQTSAQLVVEPNAASDALYVRNGYRDEFRDCLAFLAVPGVPCQYTCRRRLFHTVNGSILESPAMRYRDLGNASGAGGGGFGALRFFAELAPGEEKTWVVLLGGGDSAEACDGLIGAYRQPGAVERSQGRTWAFWDDILERVTVSTPEPGMDIMMNGWLLYQTYASRFMARAGFYQTGGAIGFRDQLQDCLVILWARPEWVREHILLCAAHQFESGDVQHWWHPPMRGVRTRISDDMLFLPYVVSEYVARTDDWGVLDERVHYLSDVDIPEGQSDYYGKATVSHASDTLLDHCLMAVRRACRFGSHGLPLMGAGDWNDAMNSIGDEGRGESVWLGWFLYDVLRRTSYLCERTDRRELAGEFDAIAERLGRILNDAGWDGRWYRRAYDDDGNPVGSSMNEDCQIDCLSQSWAAISGAGEPDKVKMGLESMEERLWCEEGQLLKLLTPPFLHDTSEPGYIKGYVPGVRENGGQYTHAAVWAVWAYACGGQGDKAIGLMKRLMPYWHAKSEEEAERYMVEPYVAAADIYAVHPHVGRGGWTWYTGSAAWMYKVTLEKILGISVYKNRLSVNPCIPRDWREYDVTYRYGYAVYFIHVKNPNAAQCGVRQILLDGKEVEGGRFPLVDDEREHHVYVLMGSPQ